MSDVRVTAVVPTVGRPSLRRAVASALAQTHRLDEVLVVADTLAQLPLPTDPRVRVLRVGPAAGGNAARQAGVEACSAQLVALLDDDDEWLPQHVAGLVAAAPGRPGPWLASSRVQVCAGDRREVWPARAKRDRESLTRYLIRKESVRGGVGLMQASSLLFPRQLALAVPFDVHLRYHQDLDWLCRLDRHCPDLEVVQVADASARYMVQAGTVSKRITAEQSIAWARANLDPLDRRTLGDFIAVTSLQGARNAASSREMVRTYRAAWTWGRPGAPASAYALGTLLRDGLGRVRARHR